MAKRQRRIVILQAAGRLFCHYGPFKTTVADIAKEAHVGVGTVYLEFRSKDDILSALSEQLHEGVLAAEKAAWTRDGTAAGRLRAVFEARLEAFLVGGQEGAHGPDLFAAPCDAVLASRRAFQEAERAWLAEALASADGLRVDDPSRVASALLDAHRAFAPPAVFEDPPDALRARLAALHDVLIDGLC